VRPDSAGAVLAHLRDLPADGQGSVTVENVDAVIGERHDPSARFGVVQRDIAPVWDVVEAGIRASAVYAPTSASALACTRHGKPSQVPAQPSERMS
jgi:hypothetical protein